MKEIKGSVMVNAPASKVWERVIDFPSYPTWNPFIVQMKGELKEGSAFEVVISTPNKKEIRLRSRAVKVENGKEALFKGTVRKGLLSMDHSFLVEGLEDAKCILTQHIALRGLLSFFSRATARDLQAGLGNMNAEVKRLCEKKE